MTRLPPALSAKQRWAALRLIAPCQLHDDLIVNVVGPFLTAASHQAPTRGHVLRDGRAGTAELRLRVQSEMPVRALLRLFRETLNRVSLTPVCVAEPTDDPGFPPLDEIYQGAAVPRVFEDFACDTSDFLVECLSLVACGTLRLMVAFDLMVGHLIAVNRRLYPAAREIPYPTSFLSLRSHADGFFIMSRNPARAKQTLECQYLRQADRMQARLLALLRQLTQQGPAISDVAARWAVCIEKWTEGALRATASGEVGTGQVPRTYLGDTYDISVSEFHQAIQRRPALQDMMSSDVQVQAMRVTFSCLYFFLHQLGIPLIERYLLCHAVSRTIEDTFDVQPADALELVADLGVQRGAVTRNEGPRAVAPQQISGTASADVVGQ
jgi:Lantibiotic biosynthesis dehydratase C-term